MRDLFGSRNSARTYKDFGFVISDIRFPGHNKGRLERAALFNGFYISVNKLLLDDGGLD